MTKENKIRVPILTDDEWRMIGLAVAERACVAKMAAELASGPSDDLPDGMRDGIEETAKNAEALAYLALKIAASIIDPHDM